MCAVTPYVLHACGVREPHAIPADTKSECEPQRRPGNSTDLTGEMVEWEVGRLRRNVADQRPIHSRSGKTEGR
jgi:hypothetical protein